MDYHERICNLCNTDKIQDLFHVIIECPKLTEQRFKESKNISDNENFFVGIENKAELYHQLNTMSRKQLTAVTSFMDAAEEVIKNK